MKVAVLYSGGKDSNFALYRISKDHEVCCLINMKSENENSYMFQSAGNEIVDIQAQALDIPLIKFETKGEKEVELEDLKLAIEKAKNEFGIEGLVTGAIKSAYQASRIQKICKELDLWCFNPLWQIDEDEFLESVVSEGFDVRIVGVFSYPFDEKLLGGKFDSEFISDMKKLRDGFSISIAGEGGEYESLVLDSPLFKKRIEFDGSQVKMDSENSGVLELSNVRLVEK